MNKLMEFEFREMDNFIASQAENQEFTNERFKIVDIESANWAFRKLKAISEKEEEIKNLAKLEIERIKNWEKQEIESTQSSKNYFEGLLMEYYIDQREIDEKFKLSTPYGKVTSRKQQDNIIYGENIIEEMKSKSLTKYLRVKTTEEIDKTEFKKALEIKENIVALNGKVVENIEPYIRPFTEDTCIFINTESGGIYDTENYRYYEKAIIADGKVIDDIQIEKRQDSISIKVAE